MEHRLVPPGRRHSNAQSFGLVALIFVDRDRSILLLCPLMYTYRGLLAEDFLLNRRAFCGMHLCMIQIGTQITMSRRMWWRPKVEATGPAPCATDLRGTWRAVFLTPVLLRRCNAKHRGRHSPPFEEAHAPNQLCARLAGQLARRQCDRSLDLRCATSVPHSPQALPPPFGDITRDI